MKKTPFFAIVLVIICTFMTSSGQYFIKLGTNAFSNTLISILNFNLVWGFVLYGLGAIILIIALKYGELSVLYPFISLSFIWVFLLSIFLLNEQISVLNWIGLGTIVVGVSLIGVGGNNG